MDTNARTDVAPPQRSGPPTHYWRHRDDEWVDEISITTVERWKESELSGDEWRFTAVVEIKRKGTVIRRRGYHSIATALKYLGSIVGHAPADYDHDEPGWDGRLGEELCAQPGCSEIATVELRMLKQFCRDGHPTMRPFPEYDYRRHFCQRHSRRGDCALEDADRNYVEVPA